MSNPTGKGGFQERKHQINRLGRPKEFGDFRKLCQSVLSETAKDKEGKPLVLDNHHIATNIEMVVRSLIREPRFAQVILKYAYGDVPLEIKDWREAARQSGLDPDKVLNEFEDVIASKMGAGTNGSGGNATGNGAETSSEVESSPITDSASG